jgi:hypothetical protein
MSRTTVRGAVFFVWWFDSAIGGTVLHNYFGRAQGQLPGNDRGEIGNGVRENLEPPE